MIKISICYIEQMGELNNKKITINIRIIVIKSIELISDKYGDII